MSGIKNLINKIGHFFSDLFDASAKAWKKLSPEIQNAMLHGSSIIATINQNINQTPKFIIDILLAKFPDLDLDKIKTALAAASEGLSIAEGINTDDLEEMIVGLQKYLSSLKGTTWAKISHTLALGIAAALSPKGTKLATISALLEYIYHDIIKGGK